LGKISGETATETKKFSIPTIDSLERLGPIRKKFDSAYRDKIDTMLRNDQYFLQFEDRFTTYADTIKKINDQNAKTLSKLIKRKGFPSEQKIGNDTNNINSACYFTLIWHQVNGAKFRSVNYATVLQKAIMEGELDNRMGAYLIDYSNGTNNYGTSEGGVCYYYWQNPKYNRDSLLNEVSNGHHPWYIMPFHDDEVNRFDKERSKYYLDGIEDYRKKVLFQLKENLFDFGLYGYQFEGGLIYKEEFDYVFKNLVEVK
jgi:hypothetical protein